jgi:hypothetical protein
MFNVISSGHANVLSVVCKTLPMLALKRRCYHGLPLASQSGPNSKPVMGGYQLLNVPAGIGIGSFSFLYAYLPGTGIGSGQPSAANQYWAGIDF